MIPLPFGKLAMGLGVTTLLVGAWGLRVDHLRAGYKDRLDGIVTAVEKLSGKRKLSYNSVTAEIVTVAATRDQYQRERDNARGVVREQSASIARLKDESDRAMTAARRQQALITKLTADRDAWIERAQRASTRLERLSAEQEAKECSDVLDSIYEAGF